MPSSVIRSYSYDEARRVLTITFVSGEVYDYLDVPPEVHLALRLASSRGRYFGSHIRNRYRFTRRRLGWYPPPDEPPAPDPDPQPALPRGPSSPNPPLLGFAERPRTERAVRALGRPLPRFRVPKR